MPDDRLPAAVTDGECCDLARKIRELAGQTGLMFAPWEVLLLAEKFERRSDYPDPEERRGSHPIFASFPQALRWKCDSALGGKELVEPMLSAVVNNGSV